MLTGWNRIAKHVGGVFCASLFMLGGCSGGGGGSTSLPSQPTQQNPGAPGNPAAPPGQTPPSQTPPPSTASSVKIYATTPQRNGSVNVYDEEGHQFASCPFTNLSHAFNIAFDSNNQRLYITGAPLGVNAFDLSGNPIKTQGSFAGAGGIITFDSNNHHLYTITGGEPGGAVFDEEGNPVQVSGSFSNPEPIGAVFDPFNRQIYVVNVAGGTVLVFDEQGNGIKFPNIHVCGSNAKSLAFDTHNRHFYLAGDETLGCGPETVTVFDEAGNAVTTTGTWEGADSPSAMAFDAHNNRLYVENGGGNITVYDEEGNLITTSGTFPNAGGFGLVAAP